MPTIAWSTSVERNRCNVDVKHSFFILPHTIWLSAGFYCSLGFDFWLVLSIHLLHVRHFFLRHNSWHVYIVGDSSSRHTYAFLLQRVPSRRTWALKSCQEPLPFVVTGGVMQRCRCGTVSTEELKQASRSPACNSCLFNLARKVSCSLSSGLHPTECVCPIYLKSP